MPRSPRDPGAPLPTGATNAVSVDVEDYFQVSNFDRVIDRDDWPSLPRRVVDTTQRLLDLFDETGHKGTFFTLGWVAEREPALIREISARGHEVASHGYGHQLVYEIGRDRFEEDLRRAKGTIEDLIGEPVVGYRAPSYSVTEDSLWALDVLASHGFQYDSSIFPIRHHRYGLPDFPTEPVRVELPGGGSILEFPMTTLRFGRRNLPLAGGAYLRFLPGAIFRAGFRRVVAAGTPTVLYVHPWEIDPHQPRQDVGLKVRINHYYNLAGMEEKLRSLLREFEFGSLRGVLEGLDRTGRIESHPLAQLVAPRESVAELRQSA